MSNMEIVQELLERMKNFEEAKEAYKAYDVLYRMEPYKIAETLEKWQREGNSIALKEPAYRMIDRALDRLNDGLIKNYTFYEELSKAICEVSKKVISTKNAMEKAQKAFEEAFKDYMVDKAHVISYEQYLILLPGLVKFLQS